MTIAKPSIEQVRTVAEGLGLDLSTADLAVYTAFLGGMTASYERLSAMDAPSAVNPGRGRVGHIPDPEKNAHNAWAWMGPIEPTGTGILSGHSIGIKDAICVAGMPSRDGSPLLDDFVPTRDASVVTRILAAGGSIAGKTACEDLSFSGHSHTSRPPVHNPHKRGYSSGGSSSGNGAAIAAGDIDMAVGCDQGGSVRIPAAWCGIAGLKPTRGLVPYTGAFAMDQTIDYAGPMGRRVEDVARLLTVIAGPDGLDPRQANIDIQQENYLDTLAQRRKPRRIAVVREGFGHPESEEEVDRCVREAALAFRAAGIEVDEISVPTHLSCFDVWSAIVTDGTSELMFKANGMGGYSEGYADPEMLGAFSRWRDRPDEIAVTALPSLLMGAYMHDHYQNRFYAKAQSLRQRMRNEFDRVLDDYDLMMMPTIRFRALPLPPADAGLADRIGALSMVTNTSPYNASGHPALSLPCANPGDLPIGMQLVGRYWGESDLLAAGQLYESL